MIIKTKDYLIACSTVITAIDLLFSRGNKNLMKENSQSIRKA
jgi:hypothetical protein